MPLCRLDELVSTTTTQSYSEQLRGIGGLIPEAVGLYRLHRQEVPERVSKLIREMRDIERLTLDAYNFPLASRRALDVGAGQRLMHLAYLAQCNTVTGIDLEVVVHGFNFRAYMRMVRTNGVRRTIKTIVRKMLQIDARYRRELCDQLGINRFPTVRALPMDAKDMSFADESFDFVFCHSVLHHIPEPERAIREVARVLEPGGVAHLALHLYTSDTGSLDPRVMAGNDTLPKWPHLRTGKQHLVIQNAWLNMLRLADWTSLFEREMPGCRFWVDTDRLTHLEPEARRLQAAGELTDYTLEELLTRTLAVTWRKG